MKEKIKKILALLPLIFLFTFNIVEARQGCCSHHGGVCGCGCCDGTPLSATCAPYYPQCNSRVVPSYTPPATNYSPPPPAKIESILQTDNTEIPKETNNDSFWGWMILLGFGGYIFYQFKKRKSK